MIRARIYGRDVELQGSPWTFLVYSREFGSDLISDIVSLSRRAEEDPMSVTEGMLRVAWAMHRTHDEDAPGYEAWLRGFGEGFSLRADASPVGVIDSAISAELFRDTSPKGRRARLRLRLARCLGSLAQRLGA